MYDSGMDTLFENSSGKAALIKYLKEKKSQNKKTAAMDWVEWLKYEKNGLPSFTPVEIEQLKEIENYRDVLEESFNASNSYLWSYADFVACISGDPIPLTIEEMLENEDKPK